MTEQEMHEVAERVDKIRRVREQLKRAQLELALVNKHGKPGIHWEVEICLKRKEYFDGRDLTTKTKVPFEVVQQQAVYAVDRLRRELVQLGAVP